MLPEKTPYLIAETAFHHEGDLKFLMDLIDLAKKSDADAIKFHLLFNVDDYMTKDHPGAETIKKISLSKEHWTQAFSRAEELDLDIIALTNDRASLNWINEQERFSVKAVEIHATGINDLFLLQESSNFDGTVILGTGGSTLDEIDYAVSMLRSLGKEDIFLMHGFQNYPTNYQDINLERMNLVSHTFRLPVGYADHTDPGDPDNEIISSLPVLYGYNIVEKHLTHGIGVHRIDAQSAISKEQFVRIKELMKKIHLAKGDNPLHMSDAELSYGDTGPMKKAIVATRRIAAGEKVNLEHISFKRTPTSASIEAKDIGMVLGAIATKEIEADSMIDHSNITYKFEPTRFDQFLLDRE